MPQAIDTLKIYDSLKGTFTDEQAHNLSLMFSQLLDEATDNVLATKKDVKELEMATKMGIKELEATTRNDIKNLELKIAQSKVEILKWMAGFLLAQTGVIAALVKLL